MLDLTINEKGRKNNIERAKEKNIILPTYEQMMHPEKGKRLTDFFDEEGNKVG